MFDINSLRTNEALEVDGVWRDFGAGARVLLARRGNDKYTNHLSLGYKKHKSTIDANDAHAQEVAKDLAIQAEARTVLLGWEGFTDKGKKLPYSVENAEKMLRVKDFRARILELASDMEAYQDKVEEELEKN